MLKKILFGVLGVVVLFLIVVATRPDTYHVERSASMTASTDVVFATVNDLHAFTEWSPWEKLDPNMKKTFEGPAAGAGASYAWEGNKEVGTGKMTIEESVPGQKVAMKLEFIEPFASTCKVTLALKGDPTTTNVTWSMDGESNFMMKAMGMFSSMDSMIGADFERGLASLKTVTEGKQTALAAAAAAAAQAAADAEKAAAMAEAAKPAGKKK